VAARGTPATPVTMVVTVVEVTTMIHDGMQ
jgi:hypothetical protein